MQDVQGVKFHIPGFVLMDSPPPVKSVRHGFLSGRDLKLELHYSLLPRGLFASRIPVEIVAHMNPPVF